MQDEIATTLQVPDGFDVGEYMESVMERFRNSSLAYRTAQVAMDGSQKLPQRIIASARDRLDAGRSISAISLVIAAWIRYVSSEDERGQRRELDASFRLSPRAAMPSTEENT